MVFLPVKKSTLSINKLLFLLFYFLPFLISCDKDAVPSPLTDAESPAVNEGRDANEGNTDKSRERLVLSADNNGKLIIDGAVKEYDCNTIIVIKGGKYKSIIVRNLNGKTGCPIQIINDGLVEIVLGYQQNLSVSDVSHIEISGNGTASIPHGFLFGNNNRDRAVILTGDINHFSFQYATFQNLGNNAAIYYASDKIYNGNESSYSRDLKFRHLNAENCNGLIQLTGGISGEEIKGLIKGLEISHLDVSNCPGPKNVVSIGMVEDYEVHDNTFSYINTKNNEHNAMFFLVGNGKFFNNRITNHQGNAIRAWVVSIGNTPKEVEIFNNIVVGSRKYSAFETQSFTRFMIPQKTTYVNVKVYHNTCGQLNLSKDWYGVVLDAYTLLGGSCEVFNNLAFDLPAQHPKSAFVSYMSMEVSHLDIRDNLYFQDANSVGFIDEVSYKLSPVSKAVGAGIKNALKVDIYGKNRNSNTPTIGAVE